MNYLKIYSFWGDKRWKVLTIENVSDIKHSIYEKDLKEFGIFIIDGSFDIHVPGKYFNFIIETDNVYQTKNAYFSNANKFYSRWYMVSKYFSKSIIQYNRKYKLNNILN